MSNGGPPFNLPNLANTDPQAARATLETAQLTVQVAYEGSVTVPKGVVIRTAPPADSTVRPGDVVKLVISRGEVVEVPDLFGVENLDLARQRLEALGLSVGTVTEVEDPENRVPPGAVLLTDPPKGTVVEKGTAVNIQLRRRE